MIRSNKIRQAARGEDCTMQILGICNYDSATVVFCHFPSGARGMGLKSSDICGGFCCSACHDAIDRRKPSQEFEDRREWYMRRSMVRTLDQLLQRGILKVA